MLDAIVLVSIEAKHDDLIRLLDLVTYPARVRASLERKSSLGPARSMNKNLHSPRKSIFASHYQRLAPIVERTSPGPRVIYKH